MHVYTDTGIRLSRVNTSRRVFTMLKAAFGICPYIAAGHDLVTVWMQE
jgi:hypothetical protein